MTADVVVHEEFGLRVATTRAEIGTGVDWSSRHPEIDVVRVIRPSETEVESLAAAGFLLKPSWVNWGARLGSTDEEFLAGLSRKSRGSVRAGLRTVSREGIRIRTWSPLADPLLEEFLRLYDAQIARLDHGVPYARRMKSQLISAGSAFVAVTAHLDEVMVGGCLAKIEPERSALRVAFVAVTADLREGDLTRALYVYASHVARDFGLTWFSLGSDPTLWGRFTKPGLFAFKQRLGFVPVPLQRLDPDDDDAYDLAELLVRPERLPDPSLSLSYHGLPPRPVPTATWDSPPPWRVTVFTSSTGTDTRPYRPPFVNDLRLVITSVKTALQTGPTALSSRAIGSAVPDRDASQ